MPPTLHRIQILRFAAALLVLVGHAQHQMLKGGGIDVSGYAALGRAGFYASGVDIFFVVSGFIMALIAGADFGRPGAPADFVLRRLARIAPPYWLFTTAMVCAALLLDGHVRHARLDTVHVVASYLFIPVRDAYGGFNPVLILGWTLNFEMLFYAVFAAGLRWPRARGLAFVFGVVGTLGVVGALAPPAQGPFAFWCNPIVFEFLFGIALGRVHASGWRWPPLAGLAVLAAGIVLLHAGGGRSEASAFWPARAFWIGLPALLICAAAALTRAPARPGPAARALAAGGDASYVLYLSHPFTLAAFGLLWARTGWSDPWLFMAAACALCVAASVVLHRALEQPLVAACNALIRRRRRAAPAPLAPLASD